MKILLTGISGFLGSYLAAALVRRRHVVIGLKRRHSDISRLKALVDQIKLIDSDDGITHVFEGNSDINLVIHTSTSYGRNQELLSDTVAANVVMPLKLLEWAVSQGNCAFINTDTYFYKASNTYQNLSNYIVTKKSFLDLGMKLATANNSAFCNMRIEHMYGPQDGNQKFTMVVVRQMLDGVPEIKLTPGMQVRDFVHVDDVVEAYLCVINAIQGNLIRGINHFEVGSGELCTIKEFVTMVRQITGSESRLLFGSLPYREGEIMHSQANLDSLFSLGWQPKVKLDAGIRALVASCRGS